MAYFDHFAKSKGTAVGDYITARTIEQDLRFLVAILPPTPSIEVLEIGPGHGEFAKHCLLAGYSQYDVVEPNDLLRARALTLGIRNAKSYLIPELAERDESYDLIVVRDVFEHLNDAREAQQFISEARRVLRPRGIVFVLSPDFMDWKQDFYNCDFSHSNPTTVRRVHEMFLNDGLTTVAFKYAYACFDGPIGYLLNRMVKMLTWWTLGEDIHFKPLQAPPNLFATLSYRRTQGTCNVALHQQMMQYPIKIGDWRSFTRPHTRRCHSFPDSTCHRAGPTPNDAILFKNNLRLPYMFYCGNLSPRKNILRVLQAMKQLEHQIPHVLYLAGGVLETQGSGCPVLTSTLKSCPEVAGRGAHYVVAHSVQSIRDGILKITQDKQYRQHLVNDGYKNFEAFSWKTSSTRYLDLIREIH